MQFYIDADHGNSIHGWLAPDNPGIIPKVLVSVPGRDDIEIEASVMRPDVKDAGLHSTGQVAFIVDGGHIADIAACSDLEIVDANTGVQIYRRNDLNKYLQKKVVYVDVSLMPQNKLYRHMNSKFAMSYNFLEKFPFDTMASLINAEYIKSSIFTGRPYLQRYASHFKNKGFFTSVILGNPIEELAERLLFIQLLGKSSAAHLLPTFTTGVEALVDFACALDLADDKAMTIAFRSVNNEVRSALASPMVRAMGCNAGEEPDRRHLGIALDNLSSVEVVGSRQRFADFRAILSGLLGVDILGDGYVGISPAVEELASRLSRIGAISNLLELDIALYSYAEEAIEDGLIGAIE